MGTLGESVENGMSAVKPDRVAKHKGEAPAGFENQRIS
jgi:hypothetical protein